MLAFFAHPITGIPAERPPYPQCLPRHYPGIYKMKGVAYPNRYQKTCPRCGVEFFAATASRKRCEPCSASERSERQQKRYRKKKQPERVSPAPPKVENRGSVSQ